MPTTPNSTADQVVQAMRRIIRSFDLHSRALVQSHGLTGPQAALLKTLASGPLTAGELANRINLSQGTVTDILNRLEARQMVRRVRDEADRRRVIVDLTDAGKTVISYSPPLMQSHFTEQLTNLPDWEQSQLLAALQRVALMMEEGIPTRLPMKSRILSSNDLTGMPEQRTGGNGQSL